MFTDGKYTLTEAISRMEGWLAKGKKLNRPQRNNNPCDIEDGKFARAHGAICTDGRFAIFRNPNDGLVCARALLHSAYLGLTLVEAIEKWAPSSENNTFQYDSDVELWTGKGPTDIVTEDWI